VSVTLDIARTYRAPRQIARRQMAGERREERALVYLLGACLVIFMAQWPRLQREAVLNPDAPPLDAQIGGALFAWMFLMPLVFYGIAAASHIVARLFGGRGTWYRARVALFWTLLAISPLMVLQGLVAGLVGPGPELGLVGAAVVLAFGAIWGISLAEAEWPRAAKGDEDV
jgi:hypothetical protein